MPKAGESPSDEVCVKMADVMAGGVPPSVGDTIQVPAKVTRIEGDNVYASVDSMDHSSSDDQEREQLRAKINGPQSQDTDNIGY